MAMEVFVIYLSIIYIPQFQLYPNFSESRTMYRVLYGHDSFPRWWTWSHLHNIILKTIPVCNTVASFAPLKAPITCQVSLCFFWASKIQTHLSSGDSSLLEVRINYIYGTHRIIFLIYSPRQPMELTFRYPRVLIWMLPEVYISRRTLLSFSAEAFKDST